MRDSVDTRQHRLAIRLSRLEPPVPQTPAPAIEHLRWRHQWHQPWHVPLGQVAVVP